MKCPVCDNENTSMLCPRCGFDASRDYGKYPTLGTVGPIPSVSALQKQRQKKQKPKKDTPPTTTAKPKPKKDTPPTTTAKPKPKNDPPVPKQTAKVTTAPPPSGAVPKNKWIAFCLCFFLGMFGAHKYYEGKIRMGLLYTFTYGLFGYGWLFDVFALLFKPNPYYPKTRKNRK